MAPTILEFQRPDVWVRRNWEDPWELAPLLNAQGSIDVGGAGIGTASFLWLYGYRTNEGEAGLYVATPFAYLGWFVQIRAIEDEKVIELFTGRFVADRLRIDGAVTVPAVGEVATGGQIYQAVELKYLLDRVTIKNAIVKQDEEEVEIDRVPLMNKSNDRGLSEIGNRTAFANSDDIHRFSADGEVWTHREFLKMILFDKRPGGIQFVLTGQDSLLDFVATTGRVQGLTVLALLDGLIDRKRGFVWKVDKVGFDRGPVVNIKIATVFNETITVGDVELTPNDDIIELELGNDHVTDILQLELADTTSFDTVRVQGDFIMSCFTIDSNVFVKAWTAAEEGYYLDAAKNVEGYDELDEEEQIALNDGYRGEPRFDQVFRQFVMPLDWNWHLDYVDPDPEVEVEKYHVNPKPDTDGGLIEGEPSKYYNDGRTFEKNLPLKSGWDYTASDAVDRNPPDIVSEYRTPMVWVLHEERYYSVTKLSQVIIDDDGNKAASAGISISNKQMGFTLSPSPGHEFGLGHFADASVAGQPAVFDWEKLIATVAVATDQRVEVVVEVDEPIAGGADRELVISMDYVKCWWIAPHTVVGIDAAGAREVYGGSSNILRNDSLLLEAVAAAAISWYGKQRQMLTLSVKFLTDQAKVGDLVRSVEAGPAVYDEVNTVITQVVHDYIRGNTTIVTQFAQLDFATLAMGHRPGLGGGGGRRGIGSSSGQSMAGGGARAEKAIVGGGGAGVRTDGGGSLMAEVAGIQEKMGNPEVAVAVTGGGGVVASGMRVAEVHTDATGGGYYNCYLQTLDADDWKTNNDLFDDDGGSLIEVLNIPEVGKTDSHQLNANDKMAVWRQKDDGDPGKMRWIGVEINYLLRCT